MLHGDLWHFQEVTYHPLCMGAIYWHIIFAAVAVICSHSMLSVCAKWFLHKIEIFLKERVNNRRVNHV